MKDDLVFRMIFVGGGVKFLHKSHIDPEKEERYEL